MKVVKGELFEPGGCEVAGQPDSQVHGFHLGSRVNPQVDPCTLGEPENPG